MQWQILVAEILLVFVFLLFLVLRYMARNKTAMHKISTMMYRVVPYNNLTGFSLGDIIIEEPHGFMPGHMGLILRIEPFQQPMIWDLNRKNNLCNATHLGHYLKMDIKHRPFYVFHLLGGNLASQKRLLSACRLNSGAKYDSTIFIQHISEILHQLAGFPIVHLPPRKNHYYCSNIILKTLSDAGILGLGQEEAGRIIYPQWILEHPEFIVNNTAPGFRYMAPVKYVFQEDEPRPPEKINTKEKEKVEKQTNMTEQAKQFDAIKTKIHPLKVQEKSARAKLIDALESGGEIETAGKIFRLVESKTKPALTIPFVEKSLGNFLRKNEEFDVEEFIQYLTEKRDRCSKSSKRLKIEKKKPREDSEAAAPEGGEQEEEEEEEEEDSHN